MAQHKKNILKFRGFGFPFKRKLMTKVEQWRTYSVQDFLPTFFK